MTIANNKTSFFNSSKPVKAETNPIAQNLKTYMGKVGQNLDWLLPLAAAGTSLVGVIAGSSHLSPAELQHVQTLVNALHIARLPFNIVNTNIDLIQSILNDWDTTAQNLRKMQTIFAVPKSLLQIVGYGLTLGGLSTAAAGTSIASGSLGFIAGGAGASYSGYKLYQAHQHKKAIDCYQAVLELLERLYNEEEVKLENELSQPIYEGLHNLFKKALKESLTKHDKGQILSITWMLVDFINGYPITSDDINAEYSRLDKLIEEKSKALSFGQGVEELNQEIAILEKQKAYCSSYKTKLADPQLKEFAEALKAESKLQVVKQVIAKDSKLSNLKVDLAKRESMQNPKSAPPFKYLQGQAKLASKKKSLEMEKNKFWLGVSAAGMVIGGMGIASAAIGLAGGPAGIAVALTLASIVISAYVGYKIFEYYKTMYAKDKALKIKQEKFDNFYQETYKSSVRETEESTNLYQETYNPPVSKTEESTANENDAMPAIVPSL